MRSSGGTNFGLERSVVARTKSTIACLGGPSFHEGSGSPCASADEGSIIPDKPGSSARLDSRGRRLMAGEALFDFKFAPSATTLILHLATDIPCLDRCERAADAPWGVRSFVT